MRDQPSSAIGSGQACDHVGTEAGPVILARNHDWGLTIAKAGDMAHRHIIQRQIDDVIGNALGIECARGGGALDAGGFGINGDAHVSLSLFFFF